MTTYLGRYIYGIFLTIICRDIFFFTKVCKKKKGKDIRTKLDNDKIKEEGKEIQS